MIALLAGLLPSPHARGQSAAGYYEDALVYFKGGETEAAVVQLKNALKADPEHLPSRVLLGRAFLRLGEPAAAEETLETAASQGADRFLLEVPLLEAKLALNKHREIVERTKPGGRPPEVEGQVLVLLGRAHLGRGELRAAEQAFAGAAAVQPDAPEPLLGAARLALIRGDAATAEQQLEQALARAPDDPGAWTLRGELASRRGDVAGAVRAFSRALEHDPLHRGALLERAAGYIDLGRPSDALGDLEALEAQQKTHPRLKYLKALALRAAGRTDEAETAMAEAAGAIQALDGTPLSEQPSFQLLAGAIAFARGNLEEARNRLTPYVERYRHDAGARKLLGMTLLGTGDPRGAELELKAALRLSPGDGAVPALLGRAYSRGGRHELAVDTLRQVLERDPANVEARIDLGTSLLALGRTDEGIAELREAAEAHASLRAAVRLGYAYLETGVADRALRTAGSVIARAPEQPTGHQLKGLAHLALGENKAARESFNKALAADPEYLSAAYSLASLDIREGEVEAAAARYQDLHERYPRSLRPLLALAELARTKGDADDALDWLEAARELEPAAVDPQLQLVELHLHAGNLSQALQSAQVLARREPTDPRALEALAVTEIANGRIRDARITLEKMARYANGSPLLLQRAAKLQRRAGDLSGARFSLHQSLLAAPGEPAAVREMVDLEMALGKMDEALERANGLRSREPHAALGAELAGKVLLQAGRYGEAEEAFAEAMAARPSSDAALGRFHAVRSAGRTDEAMAGLRGWVNAHPDDLLATRVLAEHSLAQGLLEEAERLYGELVRAYPEDPNLLNNLAWLHAKRDDPRALELARRAHALAPKRVAVLDTLGWILLKEGRPAQAVAHLRQAHVRAARSPEVRYHLGAALQELGREQEAREHLEGALALAEHFDGAADARARLARLGAPAGGATSPGPAADGRDEEAGGDTDAGQAAGAPVPEAEAHRLAASGEEEERGKRPLSSAPGHGFDSLFGASSDPLAVPAGVPAITSPGDGGITWRSVEEALPAGATGPAVPATPRSFAPL